MKSKLIFLVSFYLLIESKTSVFGQTMLYRTTIFSFLLLYSSVLFAAGKDDIRINQVGFYTFGPKTAIIVSPDAWYYSIKSADLKQTYYSGELTPVKYWSYSRDSVKIADFSEFTREGTYVVYVSGIGPSYKFTISKKCNFELSRGLIRHFYYQRASTDLSSHNAGKWARTGGHFDANVKIHYSAASAGRKEGQVFSSPKGWYDAGDYGKYIVNAGISTYQLLFLYEQFSNYFDTLNLNIPESFNSIPDLLDEIRWELDWALTMQDPTDGGVYHKLTGKTFIGNLMPSDAAEERYFVGKSRTATFDFAAICAVAYRIYKRFNSSFADSCLSAAKYAYQWGKNNPKAHFTKNPPDIVTGAYEDNDSKDEYEWASYELFIATGDSVYYKMANDSINIGYGIPDWKSLSILGLYSMALSKNDSSSISKIKEFADGLVKTAESSPFRTSVRNFYWGSNGNAANEGMLMLVAFLISKDFKYLEGAIHTLDYLLGRNGTGYCYVTGFGTKSPMNPHHRPSTADGISSPVPGFLVGGPNQYAEVSECPNAVYPNQFARKYVDLNCSYSTNEVAINWNAPAAFLAGGIEAVFNSANFNIQALIDKYQIDQNAPQPAVLNISDIFSDHATISWKAQEKVASTVYYSTDSLMNNYERVYCAYSDSSQVTLRGLMPDKKYYLKIVSIDKNWNMSSGTASFTTENCNIAGSELFNHVTSQYISGKELSVTFRNISGVSTKLIFSAGGSSTQDTLSCSENNGEYNARIPGDKIKESGVVYSILLQNANEHFETRQWSVAPDSIQLVNAKLSLPGTYSLVSFPSDFKKISSVTALSTTFGDTSTWRFYGYDPIEKKYLPFDTIRSAAGGWFYCKQNSELNFKGKGLKPDTLFPVMLKKGWNCVGNPFSFPIFWNNTLLSVDSALVGITDTVSALYVRHQIFLYNDTSANNKNDGTYSTNRELITHFYNDSIMLSPWGACWVYAEKDSAKLWLNPVMKLNSQTKLYKRSLSNNRSWFYKINARSGSTADQNAIFGAADEASDGYDRYDSPKPPSISSGLQIGFLNSEWNGTKGMYSSDITSVSGSHDWSMVVKGYGSDPVTLSWDKNGSYDGFIYLTDLKNGNISDITSLNSYTYTPDKNEAERHFSISWKQNKQTISISKSQAWSLSQDRSNSMKSIIKLKYSVPYSTSGKSYQTAIDVFDINGRCLKRLVNEHKLSGFYTVNWDGKNSSGSAVASGLYLVRLSSEGFSKSIGVHFVH